MTSFAIIVPVFLILALVAVIIKLCVILIDTGTDMLESKWVPEPQRVVRAGFAVALIGALLLLGWSLIRVLLSLG